MAVESWVQHAVNMHCYETSRVRGARKNVEPAHPTVLKPPGLLKAPRFLGLMLDTRQTQISIPHIVIISDFLQKIVME